MNASNLLPRDGFPSAAARPSSAFSGGRRLAAPTPSLRLTWLLTVCLGLAMPATAQVDYQSVHSFGFGTVAGAYPTTSLLLASDGLLYGTTTNGGTARLGLVFRVATGGTGFTILHHFQGGAADGARPAAAVIEGSDGLVYGTTEYGGANNFGTVFRMNKDGSSYAITYHFPTNSGPTASYPRSPVGALLEGSDGLIYGTTRAGGSASQGAAYRMQKNGTGITILHSFSSFDGYYPRGAMVEGADGWMYGATSQGGSPAVSAYGTVFKMTKTGGSYTVLRSFSYSAGSNGVYVSPTIALGSGGYLYGTTRIGGTNSDGVIFRMDTNGLNFSVLHHFGSGATDGIQPVAGPMLGGDGRLYGVTPEGGSAAHGTVFRLNTDGSSYQVTYHFTGSSTVGGIPRAKLVESSGGVLYGTTTEGGAEGVGTVFRINRDGTSHAVLNAFTVDGGDGAYPGAGVITGSDGYLYGTTQNGGANLAGTIYRVNTNGSNHTVLRSFSSSGGDGYTPAAPVVEGRDGVLYGTTYYGGSNARGTVFKMNRNGSGYTLIRSFLSSGGDGAFPRGLIEASDGYLYGTTQAGGSNNVGAIYRLGKDGAGYAIVRHFLTTGGDGRNPYAPLIEGTDGYLYGTTFSGGAGDTNGTVFRLQRSGAGYMVLRQFQGGFGDGRNPYGPLLEGSDGVLYGTCYHGGTGGTNGTVFRLNKNGSGYQILHDFGSLPGNGIRPNGRIVEGTNGGLYGSTYGGGQFNQGTLFRLEKDGLRFMMYRSFHWDFGTAYRDGINPIGGMFRGQDGQMYGAMNNGGDLGLGALFRVTPRPPVPVAYSFQSMPMPAGTTGCFGGNAGSASTPIFYQWQKDGTNLLVNHRIASVTNASLCITNVQAVDLGVYRLQAANAHGLSWSEDVPLTLWPLVAWGQTAFDVTTLPPALTNIGGIAAGYEFSLIIREGGSVTAFGRELFGRTQVPVSATNAIAVSAGYHHGLALTADGRVVGWGGLQGNVPPFLGNGAVPVAAISAGYFHSLALGRDGNVFAWGQDYYGSTVVPPLSNVVGIAAGMNFSLALTRDGQVVRWGYDLGGALNVPGDLSEVVAVAAGEAHALALRLDGTVRAWGGNNSGQCAVPQGLSDVVAVSAGAQHSLALKSDGSIVAWGNNAEGQTTLPAGLYPAVEIAGGQSHTIVWEGTGRPSVALQPWADFRLSPGESVQLVIRATGNPPLSYQWQRNGTNLAGARQAALNLDNLQWDGEGEYRCIVSNALGSVTSAVTSVRVPLPPEIVIQPEGRRVPAGIDVTIEVDARSGSLSGPLTYQWRQNGTNLVDDTHRSGTAGAALRITNVQGGDLGVYSVAVANRNGTVVSAGAHLDIWPLVAWGDNAAGQASVPSGIDGAVVIGAGLSHSLVVWPDGTVQGWGRNDFGQASPPPAARGAIALAGGENHSVALRANGTVLVWGDGHLGQTNPPPNLLNIVTIAAGQNHVLALRRTGTVAAWGDNAQGQTSVPGDLTAVAAIAAGTRHSLALLSNGTVVAWGTGPEAFVPASLGPAVAIAAGPGLSLALRNDGGVTAWGTSTATNPPPGLAGVVQIAAGAEFALGLKEDGTVVSWGSPPANAVPMTLSNVVLLATGARHAVVLRGQPEDGWPRLINPTRAPTLFGASVITRLGWSCVVEFTGDLSAPSWTPVATLRGYGYGVVRPFTDSVINDPQRFYRVRELRWTP